MGRPPDRARLDIEGRVVRSKVDREVGLQELLGLVPVDVRQEVDTGGVTVEGYCLLNSGKARVQGVSELDSHLGFGHFKNFA